MKDRTQPDPQLYDIQSRLDQLRRRIKTYVWVEGIALAVVWLGITFWIGLAIDYLPVMVGASEMPREARGLLLMTITAVLVYVIYRWVFRRAFARISDRSIALLLERRFGQFHDSLVTSVELGGQADESTGFDRSMLNHTEQEARDQVSLIRVQEVFRLAPLASKVFLAFLLLLTIGLFFATNASAAKTWANRLYLLADEPWPRNAQINVDGIQIQRSAGGEGEMTLSELIPFNEQREIKVAKGTSIVLRVNADAGRVVPDYCTVYYQTDEGDRGTVNLQKFGRIRDGFQTFVCDSKPFQGVLSDITFDVRGLDHRVRDFKLIVVPSPVIVGTSLDCTFPDYLVNESLSLWLPRTVELASGTQLPQGTQITLHATTNKDLQKVVILDRRTEQVTEIVMPQFPTPSQSTGEPRQFQYEIDQLAENLSLQVTLYDTDGVMSDPPLQIYVAGIEDQPPVVEATLAGIGTAVTPDAMLPARGEVSDDYEVGNSWFEVSINDREPRKYQFPLGARGSVDAQLDFRTERVGDESFELKPQDKVTVTIMAADKCTLGSEPNVGSGDRYQLDVVTPEQLLAMLERKELSLRRRLEQIISEVSDTRDTVARLARDSGNYGTAPEDDQDQPAASDEDQLGATAQRRAASLRLLRAQRVLVQCDKSAQEVLGVSAAFSDIREELINNRVDSKDREVRLKQQIADPLQDIGETMFPDLKLQLEQMEKELQASDGTSVTVDTAVDQIDKILLELDKVLQRILELETFNELMNIVRSLIEDQQELIDATKKQQKERALDLLR